MRYDLKLLKDGLRQVKRERGDIVGRSFPFINIDEIQKVDQIIDRLIKSIKILENDTYKK